MSDRDDGTGGSRESLLGSRAVAVSHGPDCLDGVAAAVCVARVYGPAAVETIFTHPSDIDALLERVARETPPRDLWITDVTWREDRTEDTLAAMRRGGWRVFWVDHHQGALQRRERVERMGLDGSSVTDAYSAARLTYDYIGTLARAAGRATAWLEEFEPAILMADDADRWIHRIPGSRELAIVVSSLAEAAYGELLTLDRHVTYTPRMSRALQESEARLAAAVQQALDTLQTRPTPTALFVGCTTDGYVSEVADRLRVHHPHNAIFVVYNTTSGRISLRRSDDCQVDLAKLAGAYGGGGHPAAAGFDLPALGDSIVDRILGAAVAAVGGG